MSARLIAGGELITGTHFNNGTTLFKKTGPLLNPAIAFGMMIEGGWRFWFQYLCCPLFGSLLAFVFYTKCFVKAEEYLADSEEGSELAQERLGAALDSLSSPVQA